MRTFVPALSVMLLAGGGAVSAEEFIQSPYVGVSLGYFSLSDIEGDVGGSDFEIRYDDAYDVAIQVGFKTWIWRVEGELEYIQAGTDSVRFLGTTVNVNGDFDILRWSGGAYYDFDNQTRYTPYAGGGLGFATVSEDDVSVGGSTVDGDTETYLTAHAEFGLGVDITKEISIVPAYRYVWFDSGESGFDDNTGHLFKVGARYLF